MRGTYRAAPAVALIAAGMWLISLHWSPALAHSPSQVPAVVRLHVLANSASGRDQAIKLQVRSALLRALIRPMRSVRSARSAVLVLGSHKAQLVAVADRVLAEWDAPYRAHAILGKAKFPKKSFGPLVLPAGSYVAFTIVLGKGHGPNWWCLLFPQLCLINPLVATEQGERTFRPAPPRVRPAAMWAWIGWAIDHWVTGA